MPRSPLSFGSAFERAALPNGETVLDLSTFGWADFTEFLIGRPTITYTVQSDEAGAPDLISYRQYSTHEYWWVILVANKIVDPYTELTAGRQIVLPPIQLVNEYRTRQSEVRRFSVSRTVDLN